MNFRPSHPDRVLHDTWVFLSEGAIHLFYLAPQIGNNTHRLIGHAVSRDWLHWRELPFIELTGPPGSWDSGRIGTGHVFQYDDGRYYMAYTGRIDPEEDIGLAASDDLLTWHKPFDSPVWPQQRQSPYEHSDAAGGDIPAWRDPFVIRHPGGDWCAYLCARSDHGPPSSRGCIARCKIDAIDRWMTLEPIAATGEYPVMEVPEVFEFMGKWWLTFNTGSNWGHRLDTPSRRQASGTFYLCAAQLDGPWDGPTDNLLIGSGGGRRDAVVARSVEYENDRLVYHHYTGGLTPDSPRAMGLPKVLDCTGDRLILRPWPGLRKIWRGEIAGLDPAPIEDDPWAEGTWEFTHPRIVGECAAGVAACRAAVETPDLDLQITIRILHGERAGLLLGAGQPGPQGVCVLLDARRDEVTIGQLRSAPYGILLDDTLDRHLRRIDTGVEYVLRLLRRDRYAEVFIDGELLFSTIVGLPPEGRPWVGAVIEASRAEFVVNRVTALEPM